MAKISKKPPGGFGSDPGGEGRALFGGDDDFGFLRETMTHLPDVDVYSTDDTFFVEVEVPGVRKDDIEVSVKENVLTVKALKYDCYDDEKVNYVCMERVFGRLYRTVEIPFAVDTAHVKATCSGGVLTVAIPRVEDKRARTRKIEVK